MTIAATTTATQSITVDRFIAMAMVEATVLSFHEINTASQTYPAEFEVGRVWLGTRLQALQNMGVLLHARELETKTLTASVAYVTASSDTLSVESPATVKSSDGRDRELELWDIRRYQENTDKLLEGPTTAYWPEKQSDSTWRIHLWPVPDGTESVSITYPRTRRLRDVEPGSVTLDLPVKYFESVMTSLAAKFAGSKGRRDVKRELVIEGAAGEARALVDDTERGPIRFEVDDDVFC